MPKHDLALDNLQRFIGHETFPTKEWTNQLLLFFYEDEFDIK